MLQRRCLSTTARLLKTQENASTAAAAVNYNYPTKFTDFGAYTRRNEADKVPITEQLATKNPSITSLHSRLNLGKNFSHSTLARALICQSAQTKFVDNLGMSQFGKRLIWFYIQEYFTIKYPRLPPSVLRHLVDVYGSPLALSKVGKGLGVEEDGRPPYARYLADEKDEELIGKLLYSNKEVERESGVVEVVDQGNRTDNNLAMSEFVRALVAGTYAHNGGLDAASKFIRNYIIKPHKVDIASLLSFEQPTRELSTLCVREGLEQPVSRLMMETGRFSKTPVFVVGVFSGDIKLGEGQGSSLKEARTRAAVHALKSWYLYSPIDGKLPSEGGSDQYVSEGVVVM